MPRVPVVTPDRERIREVRKGLNLSSEDVAARMQPHRRASTIRVIECGAKKRASRTWIEELAAALGHPAEEFILKDLAA